MTVHETVFPVATPNGPAMAPLWDGVWIVIPAYNEARSIRAVVEAALALGPPVLVVDDGSSDGTAASLDGLAVTLLRHGVNRGKAASLRTAFAHALGQGACCAVTLDGDGQHDPRDAARLLSAWRLQPERLIVGSRLHDRARFPPLRYAGNRFACFWISWAAGHPIADSQSGFRVYPRAVMTLALGKGVQCGGFAFESEVLIEAAELGHLTLAVTVPGRYPQGARPSHFRLAADTARIVRMVAKRLLRKGLYPHGLWRSMKRAQVLDPGRQAF